MLASGPLPDPILLEDAEDICRFMEESGRVTPRHIWVDAIRNEILNDAHESDF